MLLWIKFTLKLFGRLALGAFAIFLLYWLFYAFWMFVLNIKASIIILTGVIIICIIAVIFSVIVAGIGKYFEWACSPPLLESKKEK